MNKYEVFKHGERVFSLVDDSMGRFCKGDFGTVDEPECNQSVMPWIKWDNGHRSVATFFILEKVKSEHSDLYKAIKHSPEVRYYFPEKQITVYEDGSFQIGDDPICFDCTDWLSACAYLEAEGFIQPKEVCEDLTIKA
jgi:hypothetical protein